MSKLSNAAEGHTQDNKGSYAPNAQFAGLEKVVSEIFTTIIGVLQKVQSRPPSRGYEPYLVARGVKPVLARAMAILIVRHGKRVAADARRLPVVAKAIRHVSTSVHFREPLRRNIRIILAAWDETSVLDIFFEDSSTKLFDFINLLKRADAGDVSTVAQLRELATDALRDLKIARGPKISAASAAHEYFITLIVPGLKIPGEYSWDSVKSEYVDDASQATLREFGNERFDPRPANRRRKRGMLRTPIVDSEEKRKLVR